MKKILFLLLIATSGFSQVKISDMTSATDLNGTVYYPIIQNGSNKKAVPYSFLTPLTISGFNVSMPVATGSVDGYLSSIDWTNFNTAYNRSGTALTFSTSTFTFTKQDATTLTVSVPTFNQNTTGSAAKWTTARNLAGNSVDGSANVAFNNAFIVQGTLDTGLSGAQFLGALGTGIVKNSTTTGILSIAVAGDFPTLNQNTTGNAATLTTPRTIGIITGDATSSGSSFDGSANNTNALTLATVNSSPGSFGSATKSLTATVNGKGLITSLSEQTVTPTVGSIVGLGSNWATALGTAWPSNASGILQNNGSGTLSWVAGGGTVSTVSIVSANGLAGTVANATTTPAITLTTSITGMLKGNGTAISAATAGTDYVSPTNIGYSTTSLNVNLLGQTAKNLQLGADGNVWQTITTNGLQTLSSANVDSSTPTMFRLSPGAYTQITASTENPDIVFDLARDVQWATGNFTTQKFLQITAPTMSAIGASTVSKASTVSIAGAPVAGSNMTLTTTRSLWSLAGVIDAEDNTTNNDRNFTASRNVFDANAPYFTFEKSKGAVGSPATVANGDAVGAIRTKLYDGTQYTYRTPIQFVVNAAVASTFTGTDIIFQTNPSAGVESEIARFRYNGNIVLGGATGKERFKTTNAGGFVFATVLIDPATSETSGKSYGFDTNNGLAFLQGNGTSRIMFAKIIGSDLTTTANSEAGGLSFYTQSAGAAATEKFRIKPLGQFGLNTTTPTGGFEFVGVNLSSSTSGWLTTGMQAAWGGATYTDPQTGSPTRATAVSFSIARSTYTNTGSSNTVATDGSTLYIENAPATSNTSTGSYTITRPWSLWIDAGNARFDGNLDFSQADATNIVLGTGTGTKLGTSTSQKLGAFNATPIVQPANTVAINDVLVNLGFRASGGTSNFTSDISTSGDITVSTAGKRIYITEGTNGFSGQVALVSGTKAITITGVTTSSRCGAFMVTPSGTTLTTTYQCVCTSNTITLQANVAAGTINTADASTLNYWVWN